MKPSLGSFVTVGSCGPTSTWTVVQQGGNPYTNYVKNGDRCLVGSLGQALLQACGTTADYLWRFGDEEPDGTTNIVNYQSGSCVNFLVSGVTLLLTPCVTTNKVTLVPVP